MVEKEKTMRENNIPPGINLANTPDLGRAQYIAEHFEEYPKHRAYNERLSVLIGVPTVFQAKKYRISEMYLGGKLHTKVDLELPVVLETDEAHCMCEGSCVESLAIFLDSEWLERNPLSKARALKIHGIPAEYAHLNSISGKMTRQVGIHVTKCEVQ